MHSVRSANDDQGDQRPAGGLTKPTDLGNLRTFVAIVAATLPLGASIVAIPAAIAQCLAGKYGSGIIILVGYFLVVSNLDLLIRSKLVSLHTYGSFALMLLSLLGGYQLFGFFGVFYGPILMVLFLTMLEVYETYFAPRNQAVQGLLSASTAGPQHNADEPLAS